MAKQQSRTKQGESAKQNTVSQHRTKNESPIAESDLPHPAAPWNIGWINRIYNNTNRDWYIKSVDDRNNGKLRGGGEEIELDGGGWHRLKRNTRYDCEWCGIPWYYNGKHYKLLATNNQNYVEVFTSSVNRKNWIYYVNERGREIARQQVPGDAAFKCWLKIEDDECAFYIVNDDGEIIDTLTQIAKKVGEWVEVIIKEFAQKIMKAALGL